MVRLPWANTPDGTWKSVPFSYVERLINWEGVLQEMVGVQKLKRWDRTSPTSEGLVKGHSRLGVSAQCKGPEMGRTKGKPVWAEMEEGLRGPYAWCVFWKALQALTQARLGWGQLWLGTGIYFWLQQETPAGLSSRGMAWSDTTRERTDCVTSLLSVVERHQGVIMDAKAKHAILPAKQLLETNSWEWEPIKTRDSFFLNTYLCMYVFGLSHSTWDL